MYRNKDTDYRLTRSLYATLATADTHRLCRGVLQAVRSGVRVRPPSQKAQDNYHIHLIFSERKLLFASDVKIASRSVFIDETGKRVRKEKEIAEKLDKLPDVLKEDGYPDVQVFMATYCKAEAVVEQYTRNIRETQKPDQKKQVKPPERESVLNCASFRHRTESETSQDRERNPLTETADRNEKLPLWYYPCGGIHKKSYLFCKSDFHSLSIDDCFLFALRAAKMEVF